MKKGKFIIILFIIIVFFVNPKTIVNIKNYFNNDKTKIIKEFNIDSSEDISMLNYKEKLILYDGKKLNALNEKGEKLFELHIESKNFHISSSQYIDIIDKNNKFAYSVDDNGNIAFKYQVRETPISFKSINEKIFAYHYKSDEDEYIDLYGINKEKIQTIHIKGTLTDLDVFKDNIILTYLSAQDDLVSVVEKYDLEGNITNKSEFKDRIFIDTRYINNKLYFIDTNSIYILNDNLKAREYLDIDNNVKFIGNTNEYLIIIDNENNLINIDDKAKLKNKNIMDNIKGITCYKDSCIIYTDNEIKNIINNSKQKFDSEIYNIININDKTVAMLQNKKVSLLYIN